MRNNSALLTQQRVEQAALAHVRPADNSRAQSLAQNLACMRVRQKAFYLAHSAANILLHCAIGHVLDILLRIINHGLQINNDIHERLADAAQLACQLSLLLTCCQLQACLTAGADNIHNRLGLRQVNAAIEEGTLRKLARLRRSCARRIGQLQKLLQRLHAAVALQLHDILSRIGARRTHIYRQHLVDKAAVLIINMSIDQRIDRIGSERLARGCLEESLAHSQRLTAADTDDAHRAFAQGCRHSADGILQSNCLRHSHSPLSRFRQKRLSQSV